MNSESRIIDELKRMSREIERLKRVEAPATGLKPAEIKDDSAFNFTPKSISGFLLLRFGAHYAIVSYSTVTPLICDKVAASTLVNTSVAAMSGTTGTDGRITVSANGGKLYIENRTGTTITGGYLTL